jgi:hypothetical protein
MLHAGKAAQVGADLGQQCQDGGHTQAIDAREIDTRPVGECYVPLYLGSSGGVYLGIK